MEVYVCGTRDDLQVVKPVVAGIAVAVMDYLVGGQRSPKVSFHDNAIEKSQGAIAAKNYGPAVVANADAAVVALVFATSPRPHLVAVDEATWLAFHVTLRRARPGSDWRWLTTPALTELHRSPS
jgi:hypothetical protein